MNELPPVRTRLLIRPEHLENESLRGYVSRVSGRNGSSPFLEPMLESLQAVTDGIQEIATLTDCSDYILREHGSYVQKCIGGGAGVVFGSCTLSTKQVWLHRRMVCPLCLAKKDGASTCCWELCDYDVCHTHGCYLVGHCPSCDRPLSWPTSSFDACSCGVRLADLQTRPASTNRRLFCSLLADAVSKTVTRCDAQAFIPGGLTPLNWFYIFRNFIYSVLLPCFYSEYLGIQYPRNGNNKEGLLVAILNDQEYCRHLRKVIFYHAAQNPMTLARKLRSDNSEQEMMEFFRPCFRSIVIHDRLIGIKQNQKRWSGTVSKWAPRPGFVPKVHRPESHSFQLQATGFLSAIAYAFSDKR